MHRIECSVNNDEYQKIIKYCQENDISIYKFLKDAVLKELGSGDITDYAKTESRSFNKIKTKNSAKMIKK